MATKRKPQKRTASRSSGSRVSASGSFLSGLLSHLFTLNINIGGGGGRRGGGRGKGGLLKRATGFLTLGLRQLSGKGGASGVSGPRSTGKGGGRSFDDFRSSRPDLFDDGPEVDDVDQGEDDGPDGVPDHGGQPGGPTTKAHCPACGHPDGHAYNCTYRGFL